MLYIIKASHTIPMELNTYSLHYKHKQRKHIDLDSIAFRDLDTLRQQYTETPGMRKLYQHALITSTGSDETVFRVNRAFSGRDKLRVDETNPRWNSSLETKRN